jgi:hypothetical protein
MEVAIDWVHDHPAANVHRFWDPLGLVPLVGAMKTALLSAELPPWRLKVGGIAKRGLYFASLPQGDGPADTDRKSELG